MLIVSQPMSYQTVLAIALQENNYGSLGQG